MKPLIKIRVTATGAINLIMNLQKSNKVLFISSSSITIFFFTIKPTNIAIRRPPNGSMTFEVKLSSKSKNVIPNKVTSAR